MKNLKKVILLAITIGVLYTMTACQVQDDVYGQDYNYSSNNTMMVNNSNTLGGMQLENNTTTEYEREEKKAHLPKIESGLNGYNEGYGEMIYDECIKWKADPYLMVNMIKFMTVDGTNIESHQANNIFAIGEDGVLYEFNNKAESIKFVIEKLQNSYIRWEHNLHSIKEVLDYLYPELKEFKDYNGSNERYDRIIAILHRDYKELKGEEYKMRGDN